MRRGPSPICAAGWTWSPSTVCDMVPLTGLNRAFVVQGLKVAAVGNNAGLAAIAAVAGVHGPLQLRDLGFVIGPRINAGGRVGEADLGARCCPATIRRKWRKWPPASMPSIASGSRSGGVLERAQQARPSMDHG